VVRSRVATPALIGLAIETVGRWEADECVVALSAQFVSDVLSAAELLS
jgi:hypothetical protein